MRACGFRTPPLRHREHLLVRCPLRSSNKGYQSRRMQNNKNSRFGCPLLYARVQGLLAVQFVSVAISCWAGLGWAANEHACLYDRLGRNTFHSLSVTVVYNKQMVGKSNPSCTIHHGIPPGWAPHPNPPPPSSEVLPLLLVPRISHAAALEKPWPDHPTLGVRFLFDLLVRHVCPKPRCPRCMLHPCARRAP